MRWRLYGLVLLMSLPSAIADDPDPPQLLTFNLVGGPFHAGDTLELVMEWTDDSGVAQVSAYGKGPGGLDFSFDQCSDPRGQRSVTVTCHTTLHEQSPRGEYIFQYARAEDVVGHRAHIDPEHAFHVDSPYNDTTAPVLKGIELHTSEVRPDELEYPGGSTFARLQGAVYVHATDDTGFWSGSLQFEGPGSGGLFGQCDNVTSWGWSCDVYVARDAPSGNYTLSAVHLMDSIGYGAQWNKAPSDWQDLEAAIGPVPAIHIDSAVTDTTPPRLHGITFPGELHRGQPFTVQLNASDENGIEWIHMVFRTTRGNADYAVDMESCQNDPTSGNWTCTGRFPNNYPLGLARLMTVSIQDSAHNHRHYVPDEWGHHGEHRFRDDARHDIGTTLVPRPVEGEIEAIDAVVNEVLPRDAATIVYQTRQAVEEIAFVMENETGHRIEVPCKDAKASELGPECDFDVPPDADGVYALTETELIREGINTTIRYERQSLPMLAVSVPMPSDAYESRETTAAVTDGLPDPDGNGTRGPLEPLPPPTHGIPAPSFAFVLLALGLLAGRRHRTGPHGTRQP